VLGGMTAVTCHISISLDGFVAVAERHPYQIPRRTPVLIRTGVGEIEQRS
jgi:hypothetical protein